MSSKCLKVSFLEPPACTERSAERFAGCTYELYHFPDLANLQARSFVLKKLAAGLRAQNPAATIVVTFAAGQSGGSAGAAPVRPALALGGPSTFGTGLCSTIKLRGAIRLAISASPNSCNSPNTFR